MTGKPVIRVTVDVDGTPKDVSLHSSSGNDELDQAALVSVRGYRFRPKTCDGKAVASAVLVPIDFNAPELRPDAVKYAQDETPLEYNDIADEVTFLRMRRNTDVRTSNEGDVYFGIGEPIVWIVRKAQDGRAGFIVRVKGERHSGNVYEIYATQCDQPENWCSAELDWSLEMVRSSPLRPPD